MKNKLAQIVLIAAFSLSLSTAGFATNYFGQAFSNPLNLNPAYAGSLGCSRLGFNFRHYWPNLPGRYYNTGLSYDQFAPKLHGGFGIIYNFETTGANFYQGQTINAMYAFNLKIKEMVIRPAVNIGIGKQKYDYNNGFGYPSFPGITQYSRNYFNLGLGIIVAHKNIIAGISYDQFNNQKLKSPYAEDINPKLTIHANYVWEFNENTSIIPAFVYMEEGIYSMTIPSLMLKYKHIKIGTAYRYFNLGSDGMTGMIGFANSFMSIAYSHDFNISKLSSASGGTNEISLSIKLWNKKDNCDYRISQLYEF